MKKNILQFVAEEGERRKKKNIHWGGGWGLPW